MMYFASLALISHLFPTDFAPCDICFTSKLKVTKKTVDSNPEADNLEKWKVCRR